MAGDSGGVEERGSGAGEVLDAEKHPVFLSGRGHEHGLALALAGFEGDTGVAHFAGEQEHVEAGERFVDDDGAEFRGFVHDVVAIGLEVARGGLFDIFDAFKALGGGLLHFVEKFQEVADVGAALIEIDAVAPVDLGTGIIGDAVDVDDALDVPLEFVALKFDLDVVQAVVADPFGEGFGEAVVDALADVAGEEGIGSADGVIEVDARSGRLEDVAVEPLAAEIGIEEGRKIAAHEIGSIALKAATVVDFAEGVMNGGVEGAGGDEGAEFGDGSGELDLS
ncbi:MAG: hypothetical protein IANPNBLG_02007 [Bryobacteraceae bacterium]|nr:hypothetical protein [Bryobacteraceae bacterium]